MPDFAIPTLTETYDIFQSIYLSVRSNFALDEEEYVTLRREAKITKKSQHIQFSRAAQVSGRSAELSGVIGVHDLRDVEPEERPFRVEGEPPPAAWLHYGLVLESDDQPEETGSVKDWELADRVVRKLCPEEVPFNIVFRVSMPSDAVEPVLPLPIDLGKTSIAGFSEIRGVRLAEPDPDDPAGELYTAIIDRSGDTTSVQVHASVVAACSDELLVTGLDRATAIADLAAERSSNI